jgi:hypothetical protein
MRLLRDFLPLMDTRKGHTYALRMSHPGEKPFLSDEMCNEVLDLTSSRPGFHQLLGSFSGSNGATVNLLFKRLREMHIIS